MFDIAYTQSCVTTPVLMATDRPQHKRCVMESVSLLASTSVYLRPCFTLRCAEIYLDDSLGGCSAADLFTIP